MSAYFEMQIRLAIIRLTHPCNQLSVFYSVTLMDEKLAIVSVRAEIVATMIDNYQVTITHQAIATVYDPPCRRSDDRLPECTGDINAVAG